MRGEVVAEMRCGLCGSENVDTSSERWARTLLVGRLRALGLCLLLLGELGFKVRLIGAAERTNGRTPLHWWCIARVEWTSINSWLCGAAFPGAWGCAVAGSAASAGQCIGAIWNGSWLWRRPLAAKYVVCFTGKLAGYAGRGATTGAPRGVTLGGLGC